MLLRQLEYLCAVAREGHFGRAAEVCHVSQPALSAGIRKLETELDVQIVRRGQKFGGLTPEGEQVLSWAHRILAEQEALRQRLSGMRGGLSGTVRIGAIPTALTVAALLGHPLREQHPDVHLSLQSMTSRQIVHGLSEFELDIGMTYVDGEPLGSVRTIPLYTEKYLLLVPREADCANRSVVGWAEAAELPLCLFSPVMQNRRILDHNFADAGATVHTPVVETDAVSALYAHAQSMRLCSVIAHAWLHLYGVPDDMRVVPLERPRREYQVGLVLVSRSQSLLANALVDVAAEVDLAEELERTTARWVSSHTPIVDDTAG